MSNAYIKEEGMDLGLGSKRSYMMKDGSMGDGRNFNCMTDKRYFVRGLDSARRVQGSNENLGIKVGLGADIGDRMWNLIFM